MNVGQTNLAPLINSTSRSVNRPADGIVNGLIRAVRTVLAHPLTSAAYLFALPSLAVGMNSTSSRQNTTSLQLTNDANSTQAASLLPFNHKAISAAVDNAVDGNGLIDLGLIFSNSDCEKNITQLIFDENQDRRANATLWRRVLGERVFSEARVTLEELQVATGVAMLNPEGCIENMYVDPLELSNVRERIALREQTQAQHRCLPIWGYSIRGRNANGQITLDARLEECNDNRTSHGSRARRSVDTAQTSLEQGYEQQSKALAQQIRAEFCPDGIDIIHGATSSSLVQLTQLQNHIRELCPSINITDFSSLNTSSGAETLGQHALVELLLTRLGVNSTQDIAVISVLSPEEVEVDTSAVAMLIDELRKQGVSVFSANANGWINDVAGVYTGATVRQQVAHARSKKAAQERAKLVDDSAPESGSDYIIAVLVGALILLVPIAAVANQYRKSWQLFHQARVQARAFSDVPLEVIWEEKSEVFATDDEKEAEIAPFLRSTTPSPVPSVEEGTSLEDRYSSTGGESDLEDEGAKKIRSSIKFK